MECTFKVFHRTSKLFLQENLISAIDKEKSAISEMDTEIRRLERKIKSQLQPPPSTDTSAKVKQLIEIWPRLR